MPFTAAAEEDSSAEPETMPVSAPEIAVTPDGETESASEAEINGEFPIVLIGIIVICILLMFTMIAVLIIVCVKKRKPKERKQTVDLSSIGHSTHTKIKGDSDSKTDLLVGGGNGRESDHTDIIIGSHLIKLFLQDIDNPERTFEYPVRDKILIGRSAAKCQIVIDYSKIVSSVHCEVLAKGNSLYVRDGGDDIIASTNGTYVNGQKVAPELPLPSGSVLKLGQVRFKVIYR